MKNQTQILAIAIVAVVGTLTYCHFRSSTPEVPAVSPQEIGSLPPGEGEAKPLEKAAFPPPSPGDVGNGFLPTQMEDPEKFASIQKAIQDMGTCLGTKITPLEENAEFNLAAFAGMISPFMGEPVMTSNEWATTDIQTSSGEIRRIFLEYNADIMSDIATSLKYYSISADGQQKEIPLTPEQMNDPSDTLVASLEADGNVIGNSRSQRAFFQNGGNVLTVERNGKLYSLDIPFNEKRFRCEGLDASVTLKCQCL